MSTTATDHINGPDAVARIKVLRREKPKYLAEAIEEARQLLNRGFMVDETVVRALMRGIAEAYGEAYEPVYRCSLDKPAVFNHDNMNRL